MKTPESHKTFRAEFDTQDLDFIQCMERCDELARQAAESAAEQIRKRGYFNGHVTARAEHFETEKRFEVAVTLVSYGLPKRTGDEHARAIEACKRYFEHCQRVSISGRGKGCSSAEMAVRMSLQKEAIEALAATESKSHPSSSEERP